MTALDAGRRLRERGGMIVTAVPSATQIIREVWLPLTALFVWDVIVTITFYIVPFHAPELPLTLFGTVVALFLGFRTNSAYARWWEGRTLWGAMINASRSLARMLRTTLPEPDAAALKQELILRQIAYVNALRLQLRGQPIDDSVRTRLADPAGDPALGRRNVANGILDGVGQRIDGARRRGWIDTVQQASLESILIDIANAQGGMERLKNTPLPNHFRFFPMLFVHLFCVLLPIGLVETLTWATPLGSTVAGLMFLAVLAVGDDLTDPFANLIHDLPLSAMCRTIEIDLLQGLGAPAPEPIVPDRHGVLW